MKGYKSLIYLFEMVVNTRNLKYKKPAARAAGFFIIYGVCLFFVTFFAYEISSAKTHEGNDTAAERGVLVTGAAVSGQAGSVFTIESVPIVGAALEQAAALSKRSHAESEDDSDCQC
jgi:hypothetical protein